MDDFGSFRIDAAFVVPVFQPVAWTVARDGTELTLTSGTLTGDVVSSGSFVRRADPDAVTGNIFADWLEEHGEDRAARMLREAFPLAPAGRAAW